MAKPVKALASRFARAKQTERDAVATRVTIKSIAKDLGISHMTVSRALSGSPNVHKDTRDRIERRARELGYVKSAAARAMRGEATQIVGLLLPNLLNEFYAHFANAMALICEKNAFHLNIHLTNDDIVLEQRAFDRLREVQAMAVVMVPAPDDGLGHETNVGAMKVIQLIRQRAGLEMQASVLIEDQTAIRDAVLYLAQTGHRKIAYIGGGSDLSSGRDRLAAYRSGLIKAELDEECDLILTGAPSFEMGRENAGHLVDNKQATGIICGGVEISNGALSALMDREIQPGRDIALIGYGDPSFYKWINGGLTTIRLPVDELAEKTVAALMADQEDQEPRALACHKLKAKLIIR